MNQIGKKDELFQRMGPAIQTEKRQKTSYFFLHASCIVGYVGDSMDGENPRRQTFYGVMPERVGFIGHLTYNARTNSTFFLSALESPGLHFFPRIYVIFVTTPPRPSAQRVYLKHSERQTVECCQHCIQCRME